MGVSETRNVMMIMTATSHLSLPTSEVCRNGDLEWLMSGRNGISKQVSLETCDFFKATMEAKCQCQSLGTSPLEPSFDKQEDLSENIRKQRTKVTFDDKHATCRWVVAKLIFAVRTIQFSSVVDVHQECQADTNNQVCRIDVGTVASQWNVMLFSRTCFPDGPSNIIYPHVLLALR